jgi:hypothetical protein
MISYLYYSFSQKTKIVSFSFKRLIVLLLFIVAIILGGVWNTVKNVDLVQVFKADVDSTSLSVSNISNHFVFLPTHPFALEMLNWQTGEQVNAVMDFLFILLLAATAMFLWWRFSVIFYPLWQKFQEGNREIQSKGSLFGKSVVYQFTGGRTLALFKKELLISSRNWKGILWFLFLSFIWLAQIGANVIIRHNIDRYEPDIIKKTAILQALQYIIAVYFISSFTLRFVFPSFSVEKKTAWILASSPLSFKRIFYGKYLFYTLFFVALGTVMSYTNVVILHLTFTYALYSMGLFISAIIFIVTLGLSLGALFPSYENDDPEVISTSMPGLFFTALALIYGALSDVALYFTITRGTTVWLVSSVILTFIGVGIFLITVPRLVQRRNFSTT